MFALGGGAFDCCLSPLRPHLGPLWWALQGPLHLLVPGAFFAALTFGEQRADCARAAEGVRVRVRVRGRVRGCLRGGAAERGG